MVARLRVEHLEWVGSTDGPMVKSRLTKTIVELLFPLKLETSIGFLTIFSRETPTASIINKDMMCIYNQ